MFLKARNDPLKALKSSQKIRDDENLKRGRRAFESERTSVTVLLEASLGRSFLTAWGALQTSASTKYQTLPAAGLRRF